MDHLFSNLKHTFIIMLGNNLEKTVFVISTGRTGTTAFAKYYEQFRNKILATHEPSPSWRLRFLSNLYLSGHISSSHLRKSLYLSRKKILSGTSGGIYLESNPFLYGFLDVIDDVFNNAHIIHIIRNPATYIPSYINFGVFKGLKGIASNNIPFWLLKPNHYKSPHHLPWNRMGEVKKIAWYWSAVNEYLNQGESLFHERYIRVKYEDLFNPKIDGFDAINKWLDLDKLSKINALPIREKINPSNAHQMPQATLWDNSTRELVIQYCGNLMDYYGYKLP